MCNHPFLCTGLEQDLIWKHKKSAEPLGLLKLLKESSGKMVLVDKLLPSLREAGRRVLIFSQVTGKNVGLIKFYCIAVIETHFYVIFSCSLPACLIC